jgi:hypothetical protein
VKIALVTDACKPQVNGVVRTLSALTDGLGVAGHEVRPVTPDLFRRIPCPTDPQVRLAIGARPNFSTPQ